MPLVVGSNPVKTIVAELPEQTGAIIISNNVGTAFTVTSIDCSTTHRLLLLALNVYEPASDISAEEIVYEDPKAKNVPFLNQDKIVPLLVAVKVISEPTQTAAEAASSIVGSGLTVIFLSADLVHPPGPVMVSEYVPALSIDALLT